MGIFDNIGSGNFSNVNTLADNNPGGDAPADGGPVGSTTELPRFNLPEVDTTIETPETVEATQAEVQTLAPPQDIDAATIEDYTPYQEVLGTVSPEATVEGRLGGLLSQNNPYIERARTEAAQLANRRGMLNTSMAAGAAEGAAIDRALPIAQQDAKAYLEQQFLNQGYSNEAARHLADASIQRENMEAAFRQETSQFNAARQFEASKLQWEAENKANMQYANEMNKNNFAVLSADLQGQLKGLDNQLAINLETLTREYGLLENLDSIQGDLYKQMIAEMGSVLANPEFKAGEATGRINALIKAAGINLNFSNAVVGGEEGGGGGGGGTVGQPTATAPAPAPTNTRPPAPGPTSQFSSGRFYYTWDGSRWVEHDKGGA